MAEVLQIPDLSWWCRTAQKPLGILQWWYSHHNVSPATLTLGRAHAFAQLAEISAYPMYRKPSPNHACTQLCPSPSPSGRWCARLWSLTALLAAVAPSRAPPVSASNVGVRSNALFIRSSIALILLVALVDLDAFSCRSGPVVKPAC